MPLFGTAAMLLSFDVAAEAIAEHDEWHTVEHLPERLSIPGFLRGSRWTASSGASAYFVMYEVAQLATLASDAYLARLDNPSPWTAKMMPHYRGMIRGLCSVTGSAGAGLGRAGRVIRFKPADDTRVTLRTWLVDDVLPRIAATRGLGSVHLFESALAPRMTNEQRIRGHDAGVDWVLLVTGYDDDALQRLGQGDLSGIALSRHGVTGASDATYRMQYVLTDRDVAR